RAGAFRRRTPDRQPAAVLRAAARAAAPVRALASPTAPERRGRQAAPQRQDVAPAPPTADHGRASKGAAPEAGRRLTAGAKPPPLDLRRFPGPTPGNARGAAAPPPARARARGPERAAARPRPLLRPGQRAPAGARGRPARRD